MRTEDAVVRDDADVLAADLASGWASVADQVRRDLRSFHMGSHDLEELLQEVALRAWTRGRPFPSHDDLQAWARTVARNLAIDRYRRARREGERLPLSAAGDAAGPVDVPQLAEHRVALARVNEVLGSLSDGDREAIASLFGSSSPRSRRETMTWAMRRSRVRKRLQDAVGGFPSAVVASYRWLYRRAGRFLSSIDPRCLDHAVVAVLSSAATTLSLTALLSVSIPGVDTAARDRAASASARRVISRPVPLAPAGGASLPVGDVTTVPESRPRPARGPVLPVINREPQHGQASGPGERWQVDPGPVEFDNPAPDDNGQPVVLPLAFECPAPERRFVVQGVYCPVLENTAG